MYDTVTGFSPANSFMFDSSHMLDQKLLHPRQLQFDRLQPKTLTLVLKYPGSTNAI